MSFNELKSNFDALQKMPFPDSEQSEQLAQWIFDLLEVGAYYSQLALAILDSKDITLLDEADLLQVKTQKIWLESFRKIPGNDLPNVAYCKEYIIAMEKLVEALEALR
jgi:hypothetical protein